MEKIELFCPMEKMIYYSQKVIFIGFIRNCIHGFLSYAGVDRRSFFYVPQHKAYFFNF